MNLIAAVILTDDIHNDGGSRASYSQETSKPPARCLEHTMKEVPLSVGPLVWLSQSKHTCW